MISEFGDRKPLIPSNAKLKTQLMLYGKHVKRAIGFNTRCKHGYSLCLGSTDMGTTQ